MKGLIAYVSQTGQTARFAQFLANQIQEELGLTVKLESEPQNANPSDYDFILLGGWCDRGFPSKEIKPVLEQCGDKPVGLFATLGATPDSDHGKDTYQNMVKMLDGHKSLGVGLARGLVNAKLLKRLENLPEHICPQALRDKMIETTRNSREATEAELRLATQEILAGLRSLNH